MSGRQQKTFRSLDDFAGIASDWFWETDAEHRFSYFSRRMEEVTKFNSLALIGKKRDVIPSENLSDPKWIQHKQDLKEHRPFRNFEYKMRRPHDGSILWIRISGEPLFDATGTFTGYRGTGHDITREKVSMQRLEASHTALEERNHQLDEARRSLEQSAFEDALTSLANRRAFERDLDLALAQDDADVGLLHVDLDRFKWVNDTLGHPAGDQVLRTAATRIRLAVSTSGTVYRVGGDEFMIILPHGAKSEFAVWLGDKIIDTMTVPVKIGQQRATVGVSVGVAVAQGGEVNARRLIGHADAALYEAKRGGRNAVCRITPEIQNRIDDLRRLTSDIPGAIERAEFVPFFQPQFDVVTGSVIGAEALVRWQHPERGLLQPAAFLQAAAELGLIDRIDRQMLKQAMEAVVRMAEQECALPSLSVNVSEARLIDPNLPQDIDRLWLDRGCSLSIELLETIYFDEIGDGDQFTLNLQRLREMGVNIETDDFGSGRASITGLLKISPDRLKIDRSLVKEVVKSPQQRSLVLAILDMAHALGIECIAEGAETQADIDAISKLGCNRFQGFAISRPLSEADFLAYLRTQKLAPQMVPEMDTAGPKDLPQSA